MPASQLTSPRWQALARRTAAPPAEATPAADDEEVCELCGRPIPERHRHLAEIQTRRLLCVCRPCSLLFDRPGAADGRLALVPDRPRRLENLVIDQALWAQFDIPVQMAFFLCSSATGRVQAFYPSPLGPTESALTLEAWAELQAAHPALSELMPDVEALLVNRTATHPGHWIVPVDECYRLVALIRTSWKGLAGGGDVWVALADFFDALDHRAHPERRQ